MLLAETGLPLIEERDGARLCAAGYHPLNDELDPLPLLQRLSQAGMKLALPKALPGRALVFKEWPFGADLTLGRYGIREPDSSALDVCPDLVLVPLLAFDRNGNRLGYGAGYYDAALRALRAVHDVRAVGIAFDEQEISSVPREPHDEPLDMILTPTRLILCGDR